MRMLEKVPLFAGLPSRDLSALASIAVSQTFPAHRIIVSEGERTDSVYVVLYGRLKVYVSGENGAEVILHIIRQGECFGEMAMLDDSPRLASVMTLEASRLMMISKAAFKDCLAKQPDIAFNLLRLLNQRVRTLTTEVRNFALLDVSGRVARTLLKLAAPSEDTLVIEPKVTHQELGNMVGASREMVTRVVRDLARKGYVRTEGRRMVVNPKIPVDW